MVGPDQSQIRPRTFPLCGQGLVSHIFVTRIFLGKFRNHRAYNEWATGGAACIDSNGGQKAWLQQLS